MRNSGPNYIKQVARDSSLKATFKKNEEQYNSEINMALYMDLDSLEKRKIFQIVSSHDEQNFAVLFFGFRMNLSDSQSDRFYKLFIREMDTMLRQLVGDLRNDSKRKYSVLLFCSDSQNKDPFDQLKEIYKKLPAVYFAKLNRVYVVEPGFLVKSFSFINFSSWSKLFNRYVDFIESIEAVQEIAELKIHNILCKCPKQITKGVKLLVCQNPNTKKSMIRTQQPKPFDTLKREFNEYEMDYTRNVPLMLSILIETMKEDEQICCKEGIFRCAGSIEDEEEITKHVVDLKTFKHLSIQTFCGKSVAGVIKKIFTESMTPLIPYNVYNKILNEKKIEEETIVKYWQQILIKIPILNRSILCYVIEFLRECILKNQEKNKMNAHNLSVVFTPCFFRSKECCLSDLINSGKFAALFKNLLERYEEIMKDKEEWMAATDEGQANESSKVSTSRLGRSRLGDERAQYKSKSPSPIQEPKSPLSSVFRSGMRRE